MQMPLLPSLTFWLRVIPSPLNFKYFFPNSFIMLSIFCFLGESFIYLPHSQIRCRLDQRAGTLLLPQSTKQRSQVPKVAQCMFFIRTSVLGLQSVLLPEQLEVGIGEDGQGRLPAGGLVPSQQQKEQSSERANSKAHARLQNPLHTLPVVSFFSIFPLEHLSLSSMHMNPLFLMSMYILISCSEASSMGKKILFALLADVSRAVPGTEQVLNKYLLKDAWHIVGAQ